MAEQIISFKSEFDDSATTAAMEKFIEQLLASNEMVDELAEGSNEAFGVVAGSAEGATKSIANYAKSQATANDETQESEQALQNFNKRLVDSIKETKVFGVSLGSIGAKLKDTRQRLGTTLKGLRGVAGGFKLVRAAIIATGLGAVILIITALTSAFTKLQPVMDRVRVITAQVSTAFSVFTDKLALVGNLIIGVVTGQKSLNEAVNEGVDAFSNIGQEMLNAANFAKQYEQTQIDLERQLTLVNAQIALQRGEIRKLNVEAEDRTASFSDRIDALQKANDLAIDGLTRREALTRRAIAAELGLFELNEETNRIIDEQVNLIKTGATSYEELRDLLTERTPTIANVEDFEAFVGLVQELGDVQAQGFEAQRRLFTRQQAIEQEQRKAVLDRLKAIRDLQNQVADTNATLGGPAEVARRQYEVALEQIAALREEAKRLKLDLDFSGFEQLAEAQFERAVDASKAKLEELPDGLEAIQERLSDRFGNIVEDFIAPLQSTDFEQEGIEAGKMLSEAFARGIAESDPQTLGDAIAEKLQRAFDLNEAQLAFIGGSIQTIFGTVLEGIDIATQLQIQQQDQLISAIQERVRKTESLLNAELEKQKAGDANNVASLQRRLEEENRLRQQAEEERLALEKKAAQQRLIQNSIEQASNFVLAVAKLTAAEASKGIAGIFVALAGLAVIGGIIAKANALSKQFAPPKLKKGDPWITGRSHLQGGELRELEAGERVTSKKHNKLIGRKTSNEDLVKFFLLGKEFQRALNPSTLLPATVRNGKRLAKDVQRTKTDIPFTLMQQAYRDAAMQSSDRLIEYFKTRPVDTATKSGRPVTERMSGNAVTRVRYKQKS